MESIIKRIEEEAGKPLPTHAEVYAMNRVQGKGKRESLKDTDLKDTSKDRTAHKLENDPAVQKLMAEIEAISGRL